MNYSDSTEEANSKIGRLKSGIPAQPNGDSEVEISDSESEQEEFSYCPFKKSKINLRKEKNQQKTLEEEEIEVIRTKRNSILKFLENKRRHTLQGDTLSEK